MIYPNSIAQQLLATRIGFLDFFAFLGTYYRNNSRTFFNQSYLYFTMHDKFMLFSTQAFIWYATWGVLDKRWFFPQNSQFRVFWGFICQYFVSNSIKSIYRRKYTLFMLQAFIWYATWWGLNEKLKKSVLIFTFFNKIFPKFGLKCGKNWTPFFL